MAFGLGGPSYFHENPKTRHKFVPKNGFESPNISGRYIPFEPRQGIISEGFANSDIHVGKFRVLDKLGKDNTSANARDRVPRVHNRYDPNGNIAPRGENEQHYKGLSEGTGSKIGYGEGISEFDRKTHLMHVSSSASALTLSSLANAERSGLVEKSKLRESGSFGPTKQGGDKLVDRFVKVDEWEKSTNKKGRHRSDERCIQQGLGAWSGSQRTGGF